MAAPNKFSFSVRSILDLPEQDAEAASRSSPVYSTCSSNSPYATWMDCDRSPCMCECFKEIFVTVSFHYIFSFYFSCESYEKLCADRE